MMLNNKACLALLADPKSCVNKRLFLREIHEWFAAMGISPDMASIKAPDFSGKTVPYGRVRKKLYEESMEEAAYAGLLKMKPGSENVSDALADATLHDSKHYRDVFVSVDTSFRVMDNSAWTSLAEKFHAALPFSYGYSYVLPIEAGPKSYAYGFLYNPPATRGWREQDVRSLWQHAIGDPKRPVDKTLRQVYSLQFLSQGHLDLPIQGVTLRQWIEESPNRGQLCPFLSSLWTWSIPEKQEVDTANLALFEAGLLVAWDPKLAEKI